MAAPDPYRDELRAAQNRIALLEEKLADRGPSDDDDPEIERLLAARRLGERAATPRVAAERALVVGLITGMLTAVAIAWIGSTIAHPNVARMAILAVGSAVTMTGLLYFMLLSVARSTVDGLDRDLAERRRHNDASRRQANIDRRRRAEEAARGDSPPQVRIAITEELDEEASPESGAEVSSTSSRARR
jgi:hypothetical protein